MDNKAAFSLENYYFPKVNIELENKKSNDIQISFSPSGKFISESSSYELKFIFSALTNNSPFVEIECFANFKFENVKLL